MPFDLAHWKQKLGARLPGWKERMQHLGIKSTYAFLSSAALWPVVEAARQGDWAAVGTLASLTATNLGTNLLANQLQSWKDEADVAARLEQAAAQDEALRAEIDAVLDKLEVLPLAEQSLGAADRAWFVETIQRELRSLNSTVCYDATVTDGGTVVQGNKNQVVGAGGVLVSGNVGGDVVTGIKLTQTAGNVSVYTAPDSRQIEADRLNQARRRYLERLVRQCQSLPLAALGSDASAEADVTLDKIYIALNTTTRKETASQKRGKKAAGDSEPRALPDPSDSGAGGREAPPLTALEAAARAPRLALLGEAGAGKSTFLKKLLAWQAAALLGLAAPPPGLEADLLPVLIVLRDLAPRLAGLELEGLAEQKRSEALAQAAWEQIRSDLGMVCADFETGLRQALDDGRCLLALDGLDEVPHDLRPRVRQAVEALLKLFKPARLLLTCRIRSYTGETAMPSLASYILAPFDDDQIRRFCMAWYNTQKELGRVNEAQAQEKAADLARAALEADLRELAQNPMLLTTIAIIHQREVGLPRERVRLYSLAVDVLLRRWQRHKVAEKDLADFLKDDLKLRGVVEALAYASHRASAVQGGTGDLHRKDAVQLLESGDLLGSLALAGEFLDYIDQRAGLLVGRGGEPGKPAAYGFPHRTFQEYLAGSYLAGQRDLVRSFYDHAAQGDSWNLAAQMAFEELFYNRRGANHLLDLAYQLCPGECHSEQGERARLWAGQIAVLVGAAAIERDAHPSGGARFLQRLRPGLVDGLGGRLPPVERAEIGRALARLGDPRLEVTTCERMAFCHVPAGDFLFGAGKEKRYLDEFWIGKYPITNAQFMQFVAAGGYQNPAYWKEAGKDRYWTKKGFQGRYDDAARLAPVDFGEPYNLPNHPVVGVTWYEALAFTRWLSGRLPDFWDTWTTSGGEAAFRRDLKTGRWQINLPEEGAWEKAARGTGGREFPWGEKFNAELANTDETGIGCTSAAGCFPGGGSPFGLQETSGNVWEWTLSDWGEDARVLRGGSFDLSSQFARCAYRYRNHPDLRHGDVGFRVVVSPYR